MRAYTVTAAAVALRVSPKWIDNVLSRHTILGASRQRQGITRRLTPQAILVLDLALRISDSCGSSMAHAIRIAQDIIQLGTGRCRLERHVSLDVSIEEIEAELTAVLNHAVEIAPSPRRGRPPSRKR